MFGNPDLIKYYNVYNYHHLDYLTRLISPKELYNELYKFQAPNSDNYEKCLMNVKELFRNNGWEGDGEISIIWLPPFVDTNDVEDTYGTFIWHVKQDNNGTSFLAFRMRFTL